MTEQEIQALQARLADAESQKEEALTRASSLEAEKLAAEKKAEDLQAERDSLKSVSETQAANHAKLVDTLNVISAKAETLTEDNKILSSKVQAVEAEAARIAPVEFEVEDEGVFEFTCPSFTWDDGSVINVREMSTAAKAVEAKLNVEDAKVSKDELAVIEHWTNICAHLVNRNSGIIRRKED